MSSFNPFGKRRVKISSDGRSNFITLVTSAGPNVIIFNGFGIYESSRFIRGLIIRLIKLRKSTHICIQSYRDFRFLRRFCDENQLDWIIGSGGTMRQTSSFSTEKKLVITRAKKFPLFEKRLLDFKSLGAIDIIGLDTKWCSGEVQSLGKVEQDNIFTQHQKFLQLYYYGEGTPHSLVDAFSSNMDIYLDKKSFISFGLYKFFENIKFINGLALITPRHLGYLDFKKIISCENINVQYTGVIKKCLRRLDKGGDQYVV